MLEGLNHAVPIEKFREQLKKALGENLKEMILFGSTAKKFYTSESDIDILIVVDHYSLDIEELVDDLAFDIFLEFDVLIFPLIKSIEDYSRSLFRATGLFKHIQKDGISLL